MINISVALATFNEETNIADCLKSCSTFADEIVVVDGSSGDKTREIARRFGATVIKTTNPSMFHINKNKAVSRCRGSWILMLDADERVSVDLANEMVQIASQKWAPDQPAGYWLKRKNWFLNRYLTKGGQYPDPVIRFFKRGYGRHPELSVHEQIAINGQIGWLKHDLMHWATPNFSRYLSRENRYSGLAAHDLETAAVKINFINWINYLLFKPVWTFGMIFFRHRGYVDGFPGFVFALFSGFHHSLAFIKYWELKR